MRKGNIRCYLDQGGDLGLFVFCMFFPILKNVCKVFLEESSRRGKLDMAERSKTIS